jgi:hypothetical protein
MVPNQRNCTSIVKLVDVENNHRNRKIKQKMEKNKTGN